MCGASGPGTGLAPAQRRVDVRLERVGIGRVQIRRLAVSIVEPPPTET